MQWHFPRYVGPKVLAERARLCLAVLESRLFSASANAIRAFEVVLAPGVISLQVIAMGFEALIRRGWVDGAKETLFIVVSLDKVLLARDTALVDLDLEVAA